MHLFLLTLDTIDILCLVYLNSCSKKVSIKYQSYLNSIKFDTFELKIRTCHSAADYLVRLLGQTDIKILYTRLIFFYSSLRNLYSILIKSNYYCFFSALIIFPKSEVRKMLMQNRKMGLTCLPEAGISFVGSHANYWH